jgi:hypothetical protein
LKKALLLLEGFDDNGFIEKYTIGYEKEYKTVNAPNQYIRVYECSEEIEDRIMSIGIDQDLNVIAKVDGKFYRILDGIQNNLFIVLSEMLPDITKTLQARKDLSDSGSDNTVLREFKTSADQPDH